MKLRLTLSITYNSKVWGNNLHLILIVFACMWWNQHTSNEFESIKKQKQLQKGISKVSSGGETLQIAFVLGEFFVYNWDHPFSDKSCVILFELTYCHPISYLVNQMETCTLLSLQMTSASAFHKLVFSTNGSWRHFPLCDWLHMTTASIKCRVNVITLRWDDKTHNPHLRIILEDTIMWICKSDLVHERPWN